jgi:hypothetical protein
MTAHEHPAVSDCIEAIKISGASEYTVFGQRRDLSAEHVASRLPQANQAHFDHPIVTALTEDIYVRIHARLRMARHQGARSERVPFVARLSEANSGKRGWEAGWSLLGRSGQTFLLERDGFQVHAGLSELFPDPETGGARTTYHLDVGKELFNIIAGWYVVLGENVDPSERTAPITRVYFNIDPAEASRLVRLCSHDLNQSAIPFRLKVPDSPGAYGRADTAVLYLRKHQYRDSGPLLSAMFANIRTRDGVPAFAKKIGRGIAVAEDPVDGSSFGQHRSRLVARGLWRAYLGQAHEPAARTQYVADEFRRAGLDHDRPHLGALSEDIYGPAGHES